MNPEQQMTEQEEANGVDPVPELKEACYSVWLDYEVDLLNEYYPGGLTRKELVALIVSEVYRRYQFATQNFGE